MSRVLILAEHDGRSLHPTLPRVVSAAQQLGTHINILIAGADITALAEQAAAIAGVSEVYVADAAHLHDGQAEALTPIMLELVREHAPQALIAAATPFGKATLPYAAALLDCAMLSDVVKIISPNSFVRPIHAGAALATMQMHDAVKVLSIRAAAFPAAGTQAAAPVRTCHIAPTPKLSSQRISRTLVDNTRPALAHAKVVVAGGRGLGSTEQFQAQLTPLADQLNAAIGATRVAVDEGFISNDHQVGQTGAVIAPDFYFAIGVSGAAQHIAGMRDARVVVAINKDANAPICRQADYVWEGDLFELLPQLIAALRKDKEIKS